MDQPWNMTRGRSRASVVPTTTVTTRSHSRSPLPPESSPQPNSSTVNSSTSPPQNRRVRTINADKMSNELTAFELNIALGSKQLRDQITALCVSGNQLYLATKSGKLTIFEKTTEQINRRRSQDFKANIRWKQKRCDDFKRAKKFKIMEVCPELDLLIAILVDGHYTCVHASTLTITSDQTLPNKTRHAEQISVDFAPPKHRFAICSKKNIYLFEWDSDNVRYNCMRDFKTEDIPYSVVFYNQYLCYSTIKQGYIMHNVRTGKETNIPVPLMPGVKPKMAKIMHRDEEDMKSEENKDGHLLVQATESVGVFIDATGNLAQKNSVNWSGTPLYIVECNNYVVGFLDSNAVEIISLVDQKSVQKIQMKSRAPAQSKTAAFAKMKSSLKIEPQSSANESRDSILGVFRVGTQHVILYDEDQVYALVPTPVKQQIDECIQSLRIEKGLQLLMKQEHTPKEYRQFHADAGFALLQGLYFKRSMDHFWTSDVDPRDIIYLFPKIRSDKFGPYQSRHPNAPEATIDELISEQLDIKRHTHVGAIVSGASMTSNALNPTFTEGDTEANAEYLKALFYLGQFLWRRRTDPGEGLIITDPEQLMIVDTAMLKIYAELTAKAQKIRATSKKHAIEEELLKPPFLIDDLLADNFHNACLTQECQEALVENRQYRALALLYRSKRKADPTLCKKALVVLQKIGSGDFKDAINPEYDGVDLTVDVLSGLDDCDMLWDYSQWVLLKEPQQSMTIFTSNRRNSPMDHNRVIDFLAVDLRLDDALRTSVVQEKIKAARHMHEVVAESEFDYVQAYLEHLVLEEKSDKAEFHDRLAVLYMRKLQELTTTGKDPALHTMIRESLLSFLKSSDLYDPGILLEHARKFHLFEEMIELNRKLGNHSEVLRTMVEEIGNFDRAQKYCLEEKPLSSNRSTRFLELLKLYCCSAKLTERIITDLTVSGVHGGMGTVRINAKEKQLNMIVTLLEDNAYDMDPTPVMQMLPTDIPVSKLHYYFQKIIPKILHQQRLAAITKNLLRTQYLRQNSILVKVKSRHTEIREGSRCTKPSCRKKLSASAVFVSDPSMRETYHYSCYYPHGHDTTASTVDTSFDMGSEDMHLTAAHTSNMHPFSVSQDEHMIDLSSNSPLIHHQHHTQQSSMDDIHHQLGNDSSDVVLSSSLPSGMIGQSLRMNATAMGSIGTTIATGVTGPSSSSSASGTTQSSDIVSTLGISNPFHSSDVITSHSLPQPTIQTRTNPFHNNSGNLNTNPFGGDNVSQQTRTNPFQPTNNPFK